MISEGDLWSSRTPSLSAPPAIQAAGFPAHFQGVISDILTDNWSPVDNNPNPCTINRSTKQGDPLADLVSTFFAAVILKAIRSAFVEANFGVPYNPAASPFFWGHQFRGDYRPVVC